VDAGVFASEPCKLDEFKPEDRIDVDYADGAQIVVDVRDLAQIIGRGFVLRFSVHGDFIRDRKNRAADLNHLPLWLTNQDPAQPTADHTGDSVPGGEFISWFTYLPKDLGLGLEAIHRPQAMANMESASGPNEPSAETINAARLMLTDNRIFINSASLEELVSIKGIGPELAEAIVNARAQGPIKDEAALMKIPGIGKSLMAKIRNQILY